jgi:SNF2 family DNA or RNA helicase
VENQAVDRIVSRAVYIRTISALTSHAQHRLGQTRPVITVKLIIENTIEARLLEVQKRKTELANMTLGQHMSKAEVMARRMEDLNQLLG